MKNELDRRIEIIEVYQITNNKNSPPTVIGGGNCEE
jgi:hypothetical protein